MKKRPSEKKNKVKMLPTVGTYYSSKSPTTSPVHLSTSPCPYRNTYITFYCPPLTIALVRGRVRRGRRVVGRARDAGGVQGSANGGRRRAVIPVSTGRNDGVQAIALSTETEVVVAQRAIGVDNVVVLSRDAAVVADTTGRVARKV